MPMFKIVTFNWIAQLLRCRLPSIPFQSLPFHAFHLHEQIISHNMTLNMRRIGGRTKFRCQTEKKIIESSCVTEAEAHNSLPIDRTTKWKQKKKTTNFQILFFCLSEIDCCTHYSLLTTQSVRCSLTYRIGTNKMTITAVSMYPPAIKQRCGWHFSSI